MPKIKTITHHSALLRGRARGFGLLQVLLLIALLAGLAALGYLAWRERTAVNTAKQERQALAQADRAVANFATVMRRLPCPDTNRDGLEDCGGTEQVGWLPSVTLSLAGADSGVDVGQLRYLVQRGGTAIDLTLLSDVWRPFEYDTTGKTFSMRATKATSGGTYDADILTLPDLCQRVEEARKTPYVAGMAEVRSTPVRTVAYALVHPGMGDADGDGSLFDGTNAVSGSAVEAPERRPLLARYNDVVLERTFTSLLADLHCSPLIDSINTVSLAHDVVLQVDDLRKGNIDAAKQAIVFAALGAALTAADTTMTIAGGISDAGNAAADWAICAASLGLAVNACAAGTFHTSAAVAAGAMMYLNFASVAANIVAASMAGSVLALADSSVDPTSLTCPVTTIDMTEALAKAAQAVSDAEVALANLDQKISDKRVELNTANIERSDAISDLRRAPRYTGYSSDLDVYVDSILTAANNWGVSWYAEQSATILIDGINLDTDGDGQVESYKGYAEALVQAQKQADTYADMLLNRTSLITQLRSEIAALDAQIGAATDSTVKAALQKQRLEKTSQLTLLNDPVELQKQYDSAVVTRDKAQAQLSAAQSDKASAQINRAAAQGDYQTAYNQLRNRGRYLFYYFDGVGVVAKAACTNFSVTGPNACVTGDVDTGGAIQNALNGLFGGSSVAPEPNGKYLKPIRLKKELESLEAQRSAAVSRVTETKKNYAELSALPKDPLPVCDISGKGVTPMPPSMALEILITVDKKGGTR